MQARFDSETKRSFLGWASPRAAPRAGLALTVALLALTACLAFAAVEMAASAPRESPVPLRLEENYGGNFRFAASEPGPLDPKSIDWVESDLHIAAQIHEGLTDWGDDVTPSPALASSWGSTDAQNWTFYLRPGARFHNGRQVIAQDVVYSWERVAAAGNGWYDYMVAPLVDTVTAVGTDTLEITLNEPFASLPSLLAYPTLSVVPSETVGSILTEPVGAGPFQFQSWTPGDSLTLAYNDDYYAGRPYLDSITYQFYADDFEMYYDYSLGNLDLSPVPSDHITEVIGGPNTLAFGQLWLYYLGMKVDVQPLDDVRVRRALNYATDKQDLVDSLIPGYNLLAEGPVPPGMAGYDPPVPDYAYDPALALDLLAQAGWTDSNGDGILDDGAGTDLSLELWHSSRLAVEGVIANTVAGDIRNIGGTGLGATVVVSYTDWETYRNDLDQYPFYFLRWGAEYPDPYNFLQPHFATGGGANYSNYSNLQVDDWLVQSLATVDLTARQSLYESIETQVQEDAPFINLYYGGSVYVKSDDVLGLVIPSLGVAAMRMEAVQLTIAARAFEVSKVYETTGMAGSIVTYTLTVVNVGSVEGTNVVLSDTLPAGLTYGGGDGSFNGTDVTWTFDSIAANGGTATALFWATLPDQGTIVNDAYRVVSSDQGLTSDYGDPVSFTIAGVRIYLPLVVRNESAQ